MPQPSTAEKTAGSSISNRFASRISMPPLMPIRISSMKTANL
jgi:hypothetical protein